MLRNDSRQEEYVASGFLPFSAASWWDWYLWFPLSNKPKQNTLAQLGLPLFLIYWRETGAGGGGISTTILRPCPPHRAMPILLAHLFHPRCPIKQINSTVDNKVSILPFSLSFPYTRVPQHNTVTVGSR